jgi:glycosyltransferase involved in cell wall biosynthesis
MKYRILVKMPWDKYQHIIEKKIKNKLDLWSGTQKYLGRKLRERFIIVREGAKKKSLPGLQTRVDFIFCENYIPMDPRKWKCPYVLYNDFVCKSYFREKTPWFPISRKVLPIETRSFQYATAIFTFSDYARNSIIKDYGIDAGKVFTVGAGPNLNRLPVIPKKRFDGKSILFIGREIKRKGGHVLLEAFRTVKRRIPDARLVMVCSELETYAQGRNLRDLGIIIYKCANKRLLGYLYRRAGVFVMPSLYEPFGIAFLEAMAYKLPCIGTNKCAMPEIISDGKTGFLVKPKDARGLAQKIIYLLQHKKIARAMGEAGRAKVERYYRWDLVVKRIEERMRMVLGKR